jgi:hypothetical protein
MATSKKSTGKKSKNPTSFVAVTRVSLSVRQVNGEVKKTQGICGHGLERPLANYDPDTQSWKMYGDISLWGDCPLLVNLPPSGMTRSGVLYLQPPWEPITAETESLLWPTPTTQETEHPDAVLTDTGRRLSKDGKSSHSLGLADAARLWPTPTTVDAPAGPAKKNPNLIDSVLMSPNKDEQPPTTQEFQVARAMWPTPTTDDASNVNPKPNRFRGLVAVVNEQSETYQDGGKLNPTWVEWLMGFPLGWTDLEDSGTP